MPSSDYTASSGALKLKRPGGVKKQKRKNKSKSKLSDEKTVAAWDSSVTSLAEDEDDDERKKSKHAVKVPAEEVVEEAIEKENVATGMIKTEAELRFEEKKRKRLEEKLMREGDKTHKEKVEDLNRYLSRLSEHHDMYVCSVLFTDIGTDMLLPLQAKNRSWLKGTRHHNQQPHPPTIKCNLLDTTLVPNQAITYISCPGFHLQPISKVSALNIQTAPSHFQASSFM
jgi:protein FAM32A